MIVVDASAALDGLLGLDRTGAIVGLLARAPEPLVAPDLLDVEVMSALRRWERRGQITASRAEQALADVGSLPIVRYPARAVLDAAWLLRHNLTAYDAQYVALALALPGTLLTTDERMARAATRRNVAILPAPV